MKKKDNSCVKRSVIVSKITSGFSEAGFELSNPHFPDHYKPKINKKIFKLATNNLINYLKEKGIKIS